MHAGIRTGPLDALEGSGGQPVLETGGAVIRWGSTPQLSAGEGKPGGAWDFVA